MRKLNIKSSNMHKLNFTKLIICFRLSSMDISN